MVGIKVDIAECRPETRELHRSIYLCGYKHIDGFMSVGKETDSWVQVIHTKKKKKKTN